MAETKIYIADEVDAQLRENAMKRFGYAKGSISKAVEEAIVQWLVKINKINDRLNAIVEKAKDDKDVIAIFLFGSFARKKPDFRDVDVSILFKDDANYADKTLEYMGISGSVEDRLIDVSALNNLPLFIQKKIFAEGELVYSKDKNSLYEFNIKELKEIDDFEYLHKIMVK